MSISYELQTLLQTHIGIVSFSILVYDHLITFADEVTYIWARPKHVASVLFLVNRYLGFFSNAVQVAVLLMNLPPDSCKIYLHVRQILLLANHTLVCSLLALRVYALYCCSRRLLAYLALFIVAGLSVSAWSLVRQHAINSHNVIECNLVYDSVTAVHLAVPYEVLFLFDALIFVLTVYKTYEIGLRGSMFAMIMNPHLVALLLRDGSIYFVFMAFAVLSNIISFYVFPSLLRGTFSTFSICVAVTMVSRLMLNLHRSTDGEIFSSHMSCLQEVTGDDALMFTTHFDNWHPSVLSDEHV